MHLVNNIDMKVNRNAASLTGSPVRRTLIYSETGTYTDICGHRGCVALLFILLSGFHTCADGFRGLP